ncbi:MAG: ATP-binding protein [Candidatus Midichloria mitochondrii]|uniref:Uncharacterized protein n=1 Tax=Midichloria mitochondrii (strain IricVA) TaxID=696127 RepID=F7XU05_MIDMI|nr:hypothetical protein midi_01087 [Candidatus Midichloria mitochondrii IricVA]
MPHRKVIGIAGPAASGESLLANSLLSNAPPRASCSSN